MWHIFCRIRILGRQEGSRKQALLIEKTPSPLQPTQADECRQQRIALAKILSKQGMTQKEIAQKLDCHPKTISRDLAGLTPTVSTRSKRSSILDPFKGYLQQRIRAGCVNASQLFDEIQEQGYQGKITTVRTFIQPRTLTKTTAYSVGDKSILEKPLTPRAIAHFITKPVALLDENEAALLEKLSTHSEDLATIIRAGHSFGEMIRQRRPDLLNPWLFSAKRSNNQQLYNFAVGLCHDYAAVRAALTLSYSNGPTEGHINRLKCVKRQMYGRANFDLLRARLIAG